MSATESKGLSPEMKEAARAVAVYLKIAQYIERDSYAKDEAPAGLLPSLVTALAVHHSATLATEKVVKALDSLEDAIRDADISEVLEKIESTLNYLPERMGADSLLIERLCGIESELSRIAERTGKTI